MMLLASLLATAAAQPLPTSAIPPMVRKSVASTLQEQWWFHANLERGSHGEYFAIIQSANSKTTPPYRYDPQVAWFRDGKLEFSERLDSDLQFAGAREFRLDSDHSAIAVAFHFANDRSGTAFRIYGLNRGEFRLLQDFQVVEGQLAIAESPAGALLRIWQESGPCKEGEAFCVWCLHRYRVDEYRWRASSESLQASLRPSLPNADRTGPSFHLLSRSEEPVCREPKQFQREPIVGVPAPKSATTGIEGEP